ncbi:MAG TPA: hypothetical protein VLE96_03350 [Chlamydiales bacterium]|nr:hypothetical protein [Chlamydiales bacterium]
MKGTLDKGKVFRTEQAIEQLKDLFIMCVAEGESPDKIVNDPEAILRKYALAKNPKEIVKDGWGEKFQISYMKKQKDFSIISDNLIKYNNKRKPQVQDNFDDE